MNAADTEDETFDQLGERTWVWMGDLDRHEQTNVGLVVDEHIVAIDANFAWAARRILASVHRRFGTGVAHVVNTHYHVDHSLGNETFFDDGATIIGAVGQRQELLTKGPADAVVQIGAAPQRFVPAGLEFDGTLSFGASGLQLIALPPAHTAADVVAWVPGDRVLFAGDLAVAWDHGNNFSDDDADIDGWIAALDRCSALQPRVVVPAHGRRGGPEILHEQRAFVVDLWDAAHEAVRRSEPDLGAEVSTTLLRQHPTFAVGPDQLQEMARSMVVAAGRVAGRA